MKIYDIKLNYSLVNEGPEVMINRADLVKDYMKNAFNEYPEQESFWVILLNRKNFSKGRHMVTLGTVSSCLAHPREVFRPAILGGAAAIICVHNHPSGDPLPSNADIQLTRQLREASKAIDIPLLDHVIVGELNADPLAKGYYSFREAGLV
jgi:DNA repair protein RadC